MLIINGAVCFCVAPSLHVPVFFIGISATWLIISWNTGFYEVFRFTRPSQIVNKLVKQYLVFFVFTFAFLLYFDTLTDLLQTLGCLSVAIVLIAFVKFSIYYFLRKFRVVFGGNYRKVIVVGHGEQANQLVSFFNENPDYGYHLEAIFECKNNKDEEIQLLKQFVLTERIDEIYCCLASFTKEQTTLLIDFTDNNLKKLKFISAHKKLVSRNLILDYYGQIPIVSFRNIPLEEAPNKLLKWLFDFLFSLVVIVGILSWLIPVLAVLIKLESSGPVFFKQRRNGLNNNEFNCYKFRSMHLNPIADLEQVQKNDPRVTRIGKFIRSTSIDELPQFFNVLIGNMSVVGPRPHMVSYTELYAKSVNKFMVRHFIKPGITGLAQTYGFRGEVENQRDIENRVKYDIFYLENWSLLLDFKIIFLTVKNIIKGDKKAY